MHKDTLSPGPFVLDTCELCSLASQWERSTYYIGQNPHTLTNALHGGNVLQLGVPCTQDADSEVIPKSSSFRLRSDRRLVVPRFPATKTGVKLNAYEADGKCGVAVRQRVRIYFRLEGESGRH